MRFLTFLTIAVLSWTADCFGTYVLWVGIDANAQIHDTMASSTIRFSQWVSDYGIPGGQIRLGEVALLAGFQDPSGYIPPGQTAPTTVWEVDFEGDHYGPYTDFELQVVDSNGDPMPGMYADWQPIKVPDDQDPNAHIKIYYDIGFFDEDTWEFIAVATASAWLDEVYATHGYESGSLAPPTATPWHPTDFYVGGIVDVPEPSSGILLAIGAALVFSSRRRKRVKYHYEQ